MAHDHSVTDRKYRAAAAAAAAAAAVAVLHIAAAGSRLALTQGLAVAAHRLECTTYPLMAQRWVAVCIIISYCVECAGGFTRVGWGRWEASVSKEGREWCCIIVYLIAQCI
jgi:hypothetical protein